MKRTKNQRISAIRLHKIEESRPSVSVTPKKTPKIVRRVSQQTVKASRASYRVTKKVVVHTGRTSLVAAKKTHQLVAVKPHNILVNKSPRYQRWHNWRWHQPVHLSLLTAYLVVVGFMVFNVTRFVFAADLINFFDFSSAAPYVVDDGIEVAGNVARLKAQNYSPDDHTASLYHFDESSGNTANDSSANTNHLTGAHSPTFVAGKLNNAVSLNGLNQYLSAPDSTALSLTGAQTVEAWTKFNNPFNTQSAKNATILDKGSYKLSYNASSGKLAYEVANSSATSWNKLMGSSLNGSWSNSTSTNSVRSSHVIGSDIYVGLGSGTGDAEVWRYSGTTWTRLGGSGINNSWPASEFEDVLALASSGNTLFAGLGSNAVGDAEVWSCNITTNCSTWTKIGGDGLGITASDYNTVQSLRVVGGTLYAGMGSGAGDADVWRYDGGTSWTKVGGDGINGSWSTNYEVVYSMTDDGTNLYVGIGYEAHEGFVYRFNGTSWTALNCCTPQSDSRTITSMTYFGGALYVGTGTYTSSSLSQYNRVYKYSGGSWSQIGGPDSGVSGTWSNGALQISSMANDGTNLYVGMGNAQGTGNNFGYAGYVYRYNGSAWTQVGGNSVNGSWDSSTTGVNTLLWANSRLWAGTFRTAAPADGTFWSFNGTNAWTQAGGGGVNGSWAPVSLRSVHSSTEHGDKLYFGTGATSPSGAATVWEWDGSNARMIGGADIYSSWPKETHEFVHALASYKGNLFAGLGSGGSTTGESDVWRWNGSAWSQVGGDGINGSWSGSEWNVYSMQVWGDDLYVGLGGNSGHADVWRWNGSAWSQVGGDGINDSWTTLPRAIQTFAIYDNKLCAGGGGTSRSELWCWSGTGSWTQIGGNSVNNSWPTASNSTLGLAVMDNDLYVSEFGGSNVVNVWRWNGTTWTQIGGDSINGSWSNGAYGTVSDMVVYNGQLYAGLGGNSGHADVWRWNGTTWTQIGGDSINGSWTGSSFSYVTTMLTYKGKLHAGIGSNTGTSGAYVYAFGDNAYVETTIDNWDTNWHHIAATYDNVSAKIYVDGILNASTNKSISQIDSSNPLYVGRSVGTSKTGSSIAYFPGLLDEVRVSNSARTSFTTKPYSSLAQTVTLASAVRTQGVKSWDGLLSNETPNGGTITYRLSDNDGSTWKYWNGNNWVTSEGLTEANTIQQVDDNIASFPVTFKGIKWQAILKGDGDQRVTLNSVTLESNSDTDEPEVNASDIQAFVSNGGNSISGGDWTNSAAPYFSWTAGSDSGAGIKGYCLYLGTDQTANPQTAKGILGTSPLDVEGHCPFAVSSTSVDLAAAGLLGAELTTSSNNYYFSVRALDNAGNITADSEQFTFKVDRTAPANPGYITAPSNFINTKEATLTWPVVGNSAAADSHSGVAGLQYRINNSTWYGDDHTGSQNMEDLLDNDGSYTTIDPIDFDHIEEGINTIHFRTWDQAGNVTASYVTAVLKINTANAPSGPENLSVTPGINTINSFAFSWEPPSTYSGTPGSLTYCYTVNTLPTSNTCSFTPNGVTTLPAGPYATQPGANTFYVVAKDEAGNINYATASSITFTANTTAPGMALNMEIADVSNKATSTWRLALSWNEPLEVGAGVSSYRIYRSTDNINFTQVATTAGTSLVDTNLSQLEYYYRVRACDSANNCGADSETVNKKPTGRFTSPANKTSDPKVSAVSTRKATISWTTDRESDSKVSIGTTAGKYEPFQISSNKQVTDHTIQLANLTPGTTYFAKAFWTDVDGNTGSSSEFSFKTEPAPSTQEVSVIKTTLSSAHVRFTSVNAAKVTIQYGMSDSFGAAKQIQTSLGRSTYDLELSELMDGTKYFFRLNTYDSDGNEYAGTTVLTFTTPARPKISNLQFQPVEGEPTSTQRVSWTTNVPASSLVKYSSRDNPVEEISSSELVREHEITIRGLQDDTEYNLIAESRDAGGNLAVSDAQVLRTALDTRPPKISNFNVETAIRGTGSEARGQIIVSWRTDEPATSQVAYGLGQSGSFTNRTNEDTRLTLEHVVIISDLPTSSIYHVQPISTDKGKNTVKGDSQTAIIGRGNDNVFTIIFNAIRKIFGIDGE